MPWGGVPPENQQRQQGRGREPTQTSHRTVPHLGSQQPCGACEEVGGHMYLLTAPSHSPDPSPRRPRGCRALGSRPQGPRPTAFRKS